MTTLRSLTIPPGIVLVDTEYEAGPRWVDGDQIRFVNGNWEKVGGFEKWIEDAVDGIVRNMFAWRDSAQFRRMALGTNSKLLYVAGGAIENITPLVPFASTNLVGAITTASGSATVTIDHTAHGQATGDAVLITAATTVGGVLLEGPYAITVINANSYSVTADAGEATSTAGPTGNLTVTTYRGSLTNPFTTTNGSPIVTVQDINHGRGIGDTVSFANATAVGGITIDGDYTVTNVVDTDQYTITHSINASSGASGGGSVTYLYEISIGLETSIQAAGYGVGSYGSGTYGTARSTTVTLQARTWSLDKDADVLIAAFRGGNVYEWIPNRSVRATPIPNAPDTVNFAFVTEERFVVVLDPDGTLLKAQWAEEGDRYTWTPDATNQARSRRVEGGSEFYGGRRFRQNISLLWTDLAAFIMQATFDDFVYELRQIGEKAGIIGPNAHGSLDGVIYWMGLNGFYRFDGSGFGVVLSNDVHDFVFRDITKTQRFKSHCRVTSQFGELAFYYCSANSTEIDRCVKLYPRERSSTGAAVWAYDTTNMRTASCDADVFELPIAATVASNLMEHEGVDVVDADGAALPWFIRTGAFEVDDGNSALEMTVLVPDMKRLAGNMLATIFSRDYPQDDEVTNGPYTITSSTKRLDMDPRANGRQFALRLEGTAVGCDARAGRVRFGFQDAGER